MTPTWAVMVADVRVRLSDDTVCRDKSQTEARWNAGTYSGSFANCPGMTYHLVVETPAEAALMMVSTYIMNKPLKYRMDVTMPDGRVFENVKRMH